MIGKNELGEDHRTAQSALSAVVDTGRPATALLPDDAIFINVGRGNLVSSEDLLEALDSNLLGVALDVTDPEPLPDNHPLYSHPNAIITPHLAGDAEGEREMATELLVANIERIRKGEKPYNVVRRDKGY
jgi:phosphoglycerate dehydrogenase-like enzyme